MILIINHSAGRTTVDRLISARAEVKPYQPGKVTVLGMVYLESDVVDLQNPDAIESIKNAEKRVVETEKDLAALKIEIFNQFKKP
jgi:hypothetical protein